MLRIDAHQHYWRIDRGDYGWLTPDNAVLYRDFLPEHLAPHLTRHRIDGTIVVQAAQTVEETEYLLRLSEASASIKGVVGWLDLENGDWIRHYERLLENPKFVGIRVMIQEMSDHSVILEPAYLEAMALFAQQEFPVDLLVLAHQLPILIEMLQRVPGLRGVVDHLAKPPIREGAIEPWLSHMRQIAGLPNIHCKLSGMVTEADHQQWRPEHFMDYVRHMLDLFGPDRVMFGSDWPVCLLAADYDEVVDILLRSLPEGFSEGNLDGLLGMNAMIFYKL